MIVTHVKVLRMGTVRKHRILAEHGSRIRVRNLSDCFWWIPLKCLHCSQETYRNSVGKFPKISGRHTASTSSELSHFPARNGSVSCIFPQITAESCLRNHQLAKRWFDVKNHFEADSIEQSRERIWLRTTKSFTLCMNLFSIEEIIGIIWIKFNQIILLGYNIVFMHHQETVVFDEPITMQIRPTF